MKCQKCGSENVNVQVVNTKIKTNHTGILHAINIMYLWAMAFSSKSKRKL